MQPYVICRGDFLRKLAYQLNFDADAVWNDDKNAELRRARPDPRLLYPTDVLYIPDEQDRQRPAQSLVTGSDNSFVATAPTMPMIIAFKDPRCASQACAIPELPGLVGLSADTEGVVSFDIPVTVDMFTVQFTEIGLEYPCGLGYLDPINTLSGIFQRLQNLGYIYIGLSLTDDLEVVRRGLRMFKAIATPPEAAPQSSSADAPSSAGDSSEDQPPSEPIASDDRGASSQDDAGLSDDGTLDETTTELLRQAYGC